MRLPSNEYLSFVKSPSLKTAPFFIDEAIRLLLFVTPKSIVKKNLCANCTNGICELEVTPTLLFVWLWGIMSKYESFRRLELGVSGFGTGCFRL